MRLFYLFVFFGFFVRAVAVSPLLIVENQLISSPAAAGSAAPQLARGDDGETYLCWLEPSGASELVLRVARFDAAKQIWHVPTTVARGRDFVLSAGATPQIAVNKSGGLVVIWYVKNGGENARASHAVISRSSDGGQTWADPQPLTSETMATEYACVAALPDGRFLSLWLDGRDHDHAGGAQTLRSRILFSDSKDKTVDERVCDCCSTALAVFPDGSALGTYRDRSDDEIRDISTVRFHDSSWGSPQKLSRDEWKIDGCPMNGPALSASGSNVAAAWYTAANGKPAVFLASSATAGEPFLLPMRIDDGKPLGRVGVVALQNGTALVSWVEAGSEVTNATIWLRRLTSDGTLSVPTRLALITQDRLSGFPRLTLLNDSREGPAKLLLAHTVVEGGVPHVSTRLISVTPPEPDRNPCALCPPGDTRGAPLHGYIVSVDTQAGTAKVRHDEIPGLMPAMTMRFKLVPGELAHLSVGAEIYGRIESREDGWWLFSVKVVSQKNSTPQS